MTDRICDNCGCKFKGVWNARFCHKPECQEARKKYLNDYAASYQRQKRREERPWNRICDNCGKPYEAVRGKYCPDCRYEMKLIRMRECAKGYKEKKVRAARKRKLEPCLSEKGKRSPFCTGYRELGQWRVCKACQQYRSQHCGGRWDDAFLYLTPESMQTDEIPMMEGIGG